MNIIISYYKKINSERQIKKAVAILNASQHFFYFILNPTDADKTESQFPINWEAFCARHINDTDENTIYITEKPFDDNWFSHEERKFSLISCYDWEQNYAPPSLSVYLAYQITQSVLNFVADLSEDMELRMVHDKAVGCVFDLCGHKPDIKLGMTSGMICPRCRATLQQYGVNDKPLDAIDHILGFIRNETIGRPVILDEKAAFVVMRFSDDKDNKENSNAYKYGMKSALSELGIKPERADDKIENGQILDNVRHSIERCRFIIAKIDSINLNVYFELGLAMGLNKDVLLVTEDSFIPQLPADLRNWICLTYPKGDYECLKDRIKKFFIDNYHYT